MRSVLSQCDIRCLTDALSVMHVTSLRGLLSSLFSCSALIIVTSPFMILCLYYMGNGGKTEQHG